VVLLEFAAAAATTAAAVVVLAMGGGSNVALSEVAVESDTVGKTAGLITGGEDDNDGEGEQGIAAPFLSMPP
jgi:hypothetical protein